VYWDTTDCLVKYVAYLGFKMTVGFRKGEKTKHKIAFFIIKQCFTEQMVSLSLN